MRIRTADLSDLKEIARVEAACFPAAEAATEEEFEKFIKLSKRIDEKRDLLFIKIISG